MGEVSRDCKPVKVDRKGGRGDGDRRSGRSGRGRRGRRGARPDCEVGLSLDAVEHGLVGRALAAAKAATMDLAHVLFEVIAIYY